MPFKTIDQAEIIDSVVQHYQASERDLELHKVNKQRYETMLETLPEGKFRDRIIHLLAETNERIEEVSAIIAATEPQLPKAAELTASLDRIKVKAESAKVV